MHIGLFFGSFNPIHNGHLMLAQWMVNFGGIDEVWFVVSPQNPFKVNTSLAPSESRVEMVKRAIATSDKMRVCDIELSLPIPSYTANTLQALHEKYPDDIFSIIMGGDNVAGLPKWYKAEEVLKHQILVYPRPNCDKVEVPNANIEYTNAPQIDISSTQIRQWVQQQKLINHFVPQSVADYIAEKALYR